MKFFAAITTLLHRGVTVSVALGWHWHTTYTNTNTRPWCSAQLEVAGSIPNHGTMAACKNVCAAL